jgi:hypothetical protein
VFQEQYRHSGTALGPGPEAIDAGSKAGTKAMRGEEGRLGERDAD